MRFISILLLFILVLGGCFFAFSTHVVAAQKLEPFTMETISDEDLATIKYQIEELRERYYANNANKHQIIDIFNIYGLLKEREYSTVVCLLIGEMAKNGGKGDLFALDLGLSPLSRCSPGRRIEERDAAQIKAAEAGAPLALSGAGWLIGTGFMRVQDKVRGEAYLKRACDMGYMGGCQSLTAFYARINEVGKMCASSKEAYDEFGFEVFGSHIVSQDSLIYKLQSTCYTFSDKDYTKFQMDYDWLSDFDTLEAKYLQASIQSMREPVLAKRMFEELEKSNDMHFVANAQKCLSQMYRFGYGVPVDFKLSDEYAKKASNNGVLYATVYQRDGRDIILPTQIVIADYQVGCFPDPKNPFIKNGRSN